MEISLKRKCICLLLILAIMLQSCTAYKNTSVTFDEAVAKKTPVKVTRNGGESDVFKRIEKKDEVYYGLTKTNGKDTLIIINENDYTKIQPKNKPVSALLTAGTIILPLAIAVGTIQQFP